MDELRAILFGFAWRFSLLCFLLFIFFSCITERRRQKICASCPAVIKDSVITKTSVIKKDTVIYISQKGEAIYLPNPCAELCDSIGRIKHRVDIEHKKNGIVSSLIISKDSIECDCKDDSLKTVISGLNKTIIEKEQHFKTKIVERKTNEFTKWQSFLIVSAEFFWPILLLVLVVMLIKYYAKFHLP